MIPYARLMPGHGFQPGRTLLYYLQRLVSVPAPRRIVSRLLAAFVNLGNRAPAARARDPATTRALRTLQTRGIVHLPPLASAAQIKSIYDYFTDRPVIGPEGRRMSIEDLPPGAPAAAYDLQTVVDCPGLLELVNAPHVLQIAAGYIGCKPTLSSLGVRWSFPAAADRAHFQNFHRDIDDWRFLKLFVYLTDVDEDCGPHCYVHGSHRQAFLWKARDYPPDEVEAAFGRHRMETITGPRGATFIADTLGVHRGGTVRRSPRLILQAQYSILPVFAFRYAPASFAAAAALDAYVNRLLVAPTSA